MHYRSLLATASICLITACSQIPEKLATDSGQRLLPYPPADQPYQPGQQARWGGVIAAIENRADSTVLDVVNFPLGSNSRPRPGDESDGRFRVYVRGFLEPHIYQPGRLITVLGKTGPREAVTLDQHRLVQPVVYSSAVYLWPEPEPTKPDTLFVPYVIFRPVYVPL